jgi:NhaP-type Na+/H+ or K+/H+ antiporter
MSDLRLVELVLGMFLVFIPPLVYSAAVFVSPEEIRAYLQPLALLSVGLVLATMAAVAVVAHFTVGLAWAPAAALGAIVSSTDATAVAAMAENVPMPAGVVRILQGESLFNDATSLVLYRLAVAGAATSAGSITEAGWEFVIAALGGIAIGLAVGWIAVQVRPTTEATSTSPSDSTKRGQQLSAHRRRPWQNSGAFLASISVYILYN